MTECPIDCLRVACPEDTWLQSHESFVLTLTASLSALLGMILSYCLKSRCTKIKFCGFSCDRVPVSLKDLNVIRSSEV